MNVTKLDRVFHHFHYRGHMARLFPPDFDFTTVEHSERRVAEFFVKGLDDSWYVIPQIPILSKGKDFEIDLILLSHDHGMFIVEVKGGRITVENGKWKTWDHTLKKSPAEQAVKAKYALLGELQKMKLHLDGVFTQHIVAFPDIIDFPASGADPSTPRSIVFTEQELRNPAEHLRPLFQANKMASDETVLSILRALKPTVPEIEVNGGYVAGATQRISQTSVDELRLLFGLDDNTRIVIRGGAGTGKTYLAHHWAKRSLRRGEKTLVVCFNRALGQDIYDNLVDFSHETQTSHLLHAGSFHAIANTLLGDKRLKVPETPESDFWHEAHAQALITHRDVIEHRFDTIIIDEGQDFRASWFAALEGLLVDKDNSRFYVAHDNEQNLFVEGSSTPRHATFFRLRENVRSTRRIAKLGKKLGGALPGKMAPIGPEVDIHVVGAAKERRKKIGEVLTKITEELHIPLSQILILVPHRADIDDLTSSPVKDFEIKRWSDRDDESVACATIQGTKGLERLAVIVASLDGEVEQNVIYVGITRASVYLALIGTQQFIDKATSAAIQPDQDESASELTADSTDHIRDI
jgi:hypothetical protein